MTPLNIAACASLNGLQAFAVTDHNAIENVRAVMECAEAFGVIAIPGIEVQTAEDIHVVALFETIEELESFYNTLEFPSIENRPDIFGDQLIINSDDEITGIYNRFLLTSASCGIYDVTKNIKKAGGAAILAHIDRDANGILAILGAVPEDLIYDALEFSPYADSELKKKYADCLTLTCSDSHRLGTLMPCSNLINVSEVTIKGIFEALRH